MRRGVEGRRKGIGQLDIIAGLKSLCPTPDMPYPVTPQYQYYMKLKPIVAGNMVPLFRPHSHLDVLL